MIKIVWISIPTFSFCCVNRDGPGESNSRDDWKLSATETEIHFKRAFSRIKILPLDQTIHSFKIIFKDVLTKKMQKIGVIQKNNSCSHKKFGWITNINWNEFQVQSLQKNGIILSSIRFPPFFLGNSQEPANLPKCQRGFFSSDYRAAAKNVGKVFWGAETNYGTTISLSCF